MAISIPLSGERMINSPPVVFHSVFASADDAEIFLNTLVKV